MTHPIHSALNDHLRRYDNNSDDDGDNSDASSSPKSGVGDNGTSDQRPVLSSVINWLYPLRGLTQTNVFSQWWHRNSPFIAEVARKCRAILMALLLPLSPCAARQAGYRGTSHHVFRALDHLDASLPRGGRGWSKRWINRPRWRPDATLCYSFTIDEHVGSVGVAAVVIVFAAVSWCSWRRSPPGWSILLLELACGTTWVANYVAREDGRKEAKVLVSHLMSLEHSLAPFFHAVESSSRMIKCAQALAFGLCLSAPMPPIARMESRLDFTDGDGARRGRVALRELRAILMDVLVGGIEQVNASRMIQSSGATALGGNHPNISDDGGQASDSGTGQNPHLLAYVIEAEYKLAENLRRFVAEIADRVDQAIAVPGEWGLWWESRLGNAPGAIRNMMEYFEAASSRLEMAIGRDSPLFIPEERIGPARDIATIAETISALRLRYEEIIVRLYVCQNHVQTILRDPVRGTEDNWEDVRQAFGDALESVGVNGGEAELWRKSDIIVNGRSGSGDSGDTVLPQSPERREDTTHMSEAGVEWVSLTAPHAEPSTVFEDGNGDEGTRNEVPTLGDAGVTNVLIGVASPTRHRRERDETDFPPSGIGEVDAVRSRSELLGELGLVLRSRRLPPTREKHLPLESQQHVQDENSKKATDMDIAEPSIFASPLDREPLGPPEPVFETPGGANLLSELRAQLSMAANEEIFSMDRDQWAVESDTEEDSILVQREDSRLESPSDSPTRDETR